MKRLLLFFALFSVYVFGQSDSTIVQLHAKTTTVTGDFLVMSEADTDYFKITYGNFLAEVFADMRSDGTITNGDDTKYPTEDDVRDYVVGLGYITGNQSITLSGDVSGTGTTAITTTIGADKVLESMLKSVNAATDEYVLTYESTTGDFEWEVDETGGTPDSNTVFLTINDAKQGYIEKSDTTGSGGNAATRYQLLTGLAGKQPLESTLTDIADGTIAENLVNTTNPWAENEVVSTMATETEANTWAYRSKDSSIVDGTANNQYLQYDLGSGWKALSAAATVDSMFKNLTKDFGEISFSSGSASVDANAIDSTNITAGTIAESDLNIANAPTDEYVLTYEVSTGNFAWQADNTGGVSDGDKGDITVSASGATWTIDANTIDSTNITAGTIAESDLDVDNAPTDEYVLTWEATGGKFSWQQDATGGTPDSNTVFLTVYDAAQAYINKTGETGMTGTHDYGGATFEIPNSASDQTLGNAGEFGINTTDEQLSVHSAADGEISGEVSIPLIQTYSITFDPDAVCDGAVDALYMFQVGDDFPEGIIIDEWKLSFSQDPTTELDADLSRASAIIGQTGEADIDALDTTNGVASEDTDANINAGAVVANGQYIYIEFVTPYTATGEQITFQMWYHGEED